MHLPLSAPHLTGRLPVATVLLSAAYAVAVAVALTAPGQHVLAGCVVLAGLVSRSVVRRHRSPAAAAVDTVLPAEAAAAPAPAA